MIRPLSPPRVDDRAPCKTGDADRFFPYPGTSDKRINKVKAECATCPFRDPCLAWAVHYKEDGIWGGKTDRERRGIAEAWGVTQRIVKVKVVPHGPTKDNLVPHGTAVGVESHRKRYTALCDVCAEFDAERKNGRAAS